MDKNALRSIFSDASLAGWSLRSDVQLQEWLEGFAERLKERTKEVAAEVDRLRTETGNVELHLQNSFNSLRALSATQFIENRVDEVDEVFVTKSEQPIRQSRVEGYDTQIIPRYKEAVLVAWDAFEAFRNSKESSDVKSRRTSQAPQTSPPLKLPYIIGTEEFSRDIHCGLADFKFPEVAARASSSEPVESGSDTDRDEARMAAEMVGGRTWLEGEWSASESETSGHQGGVLEPAVSAALDFKAMLEAALRGPSFPYDMPNLDNVHVQHSFVDNSITLDAQDSDNNAPRICEILLKLDSVKFVGRTRSEPGEIKLDEDSPSKYGSQAPVEDDMQHQSQGVAPETPVEVNKPVFLQPPPIQMPPALNRNDFTGPTTPSTSTPNHSLSSPREGFPDDLERSLGISPRMNPLSQAISKTENKPQLRPPIATTEDLPMPTLPDGLFQGLQEAIQARQLRSQKDEATDEVRSPIPVAGKLAPLKLDSRGPFSTKTTSKLQKESKGASPIVFQGGLFDDDEEEEFLSKEVTPKEGVTTRVGEKQGGSPVLGPLFVPKQGLFDELSGGSPSGSGAGRVQRTSLPDWKDAKRSSVLKKSLFGDSDSEDSE